MAHLPAFWGADDPAKGEASPNAADAVLALSGTSAAASPNTKGANALAGGQTKLLGAVSTLMALTPRGRADELARLCALAHGYIGIASEEELMALAKAVASRDDIASGLPDRLARTNMRAAQTLIRANRLSEETIAYLLDTADEALQTLIARHHTLHAKHITKLVAKGSAPVLKALLENRQSDFSHDTQKVVERRAASLDGADKPANDPLSHLMDKPANAQSPQRSAQDFATMDSAGRRAVLRRLAEDAPRDVSYSGARQALDPTRNDADLQFLTVIEQRDPQALCDAFSQALGIKPSTVRSLMDEADGDALIVLAKGAGLSSTAFARMLILGKVGLTGSPRDTFALVDRFNALPQATADLIVQAIQGDARTKANAAPQPTARRTMPAPSEQMQSQPQATTGSPTLSSAAKPRSILSLAAKPSGAVPAQGFRKAI